MNKDRDRPPQRECCSGPLLRKEGAVRLPLPDVFLFSSSCG